jgi:hypothetical protein
MSSLSTYRVFKRRLELEAYLYDAAGKVSVSGRRAARDMTRLSAGRRQRRPVQHAPVPREERVCTWCAAQLQATDVGDTAADATLATTLPALPVEDEQHVLLHCPHYVQLRADLFEEVLRLTSVKDICGRTVLSSGPSGWRIYWALLAVLAVCCRRCRLCRAAYGAGWTICQRRARKSDVLTCLYARRASDTSDA